MNDMPDNTKGKAATPAANHLFVINDKNPVLLDKEKKDIFVHLVMQALYLSQRGRPDIRTAVSFLCTRLQNLDLDKYKKLAHMMKYLQNTLYLKL